MLKPEYITIVDCGEDNQGIPFCNSLFQVISFVDKEQLEVTTIVIRDNIKYPVFYDIDDFLSIFVFQILHKEWINQSRNKPSQKKYQEYIQFKERMINHYIYIFAILYDLMKKEGWPEEQIKKYSPRAYKYLMEYLNN
jgi:hypothetical protein